MRMYWPFTRRLRTLWLYSNTSQYLKRYAIRSGVPRGIFRGKTCSAFQFGQGIGQYGALRCAIGQVDKETQKWIPAKPTRDDYNNTTEPHDRGAVLVAAVFEAFLDIYRRRSADLIRLATSGTGVLPRGEIPHDLVNRLAQEASKTAEHLLNICIRALDYCPPVDLKFGEYLRALITADRDLVPDDRWGYRPAFIQGFRRRGIYPENVRNLSSESLCWERPAVNFSLDGMFKNLELSWDLRGQKKGLRGLPAKRIIGTQVAHGRPRHQRCRYGSARLLPARARYVGRQTGQASRLRSPLVRPVRRIGPDGQQRTDLVVEIVQSWFPADESGKFRGGCTLIVDLQERAIRYAVSKRVGHPDRMQQQEEFQMKMAQGTLGFSYLGGSALTREPFAMIHPGM
jgi:hypothetical protein